MPFLLGPGAPAIEFLGGVPRRFPIAGGAIVVAWARQYGVRLLADALGQGLGSVDVVVGMAGQGTSAEALALLVQRSGRLFVFHKHHRQTFHPKIYLLTDGAQPPQNAALLVGSSNLTGGGLYQNFEGNLALDLKPASRVFDRKLFRSVTREIEGLISSPFCRQITTDLQIRELLDDGYISTERALERKRAIEGAAAARRGRRRNMPEEPPPPLPEVSIPALDFTFRQANEPLTKGLRRAEPEVARYFVMSLAAFDTSHKTGKLGTQDISIPKRAVPFFPPVRKTERRDADAYFQVELSAPGRTEIIEYRFYRREPGPRGHADWRVNVKRATQDMAKSGDLILFERLGEESNVQYRVRLISPDDPAYRPLLRACTETGERGGRAGVKRWGFFL